MQAMLGMVFMVCMFLPFKTSFRAMLCIHNLTLLTFLLNILN